MKPLLRMPFARLAVVLSLAGLLVGLATAFLIPSRYTSVALLLLRDNDSGAATRQNLTFNFTSVAAKVMSRNSLSHLIQAGHLSLYPDQRQTEMLEDVIETMRKDLQMRSVQSVPDGVQVEIRFTYPNAARAQATVQALITRFREEEQVLSRRAVESGQPLTPEQNLLRHIARLESRISELEKHAGMPMIAAASSPVDYGVLAEVVEPPSLPTAPAWPNRTMITAVGIGSGLFMAMMVAVFRPTGPAAVPIAS